jgi:hypothetical protein
VDVKILVPGIVGAIFGALGWLLVGLYMQRNSYLRQAMNAGRAVYFELVMNRLSVDVALNYDSFAPLSRSSFDRLLPELATWMQPGELHTIVSAYMGHVGYDQVRTESGLPLDVRRQSLSGILAAQQKALELIAQRVFSPAQAREMERLTAGESSE